MSSSLEKLAAAALIIAIIALPLSLYTIISLNKNLQQTNNQIQQLQKKIETLNQTQIKQTRNLEKTIQDINNQYKNLANKINTLDTKLNKQTQNNTKLSQQLVNLAENLSTLTAIVQNLQGQVKTLNNTQKTQLEILEGQLQQLQDKLQKLEEEYANRMFPATVRDATGDTVIIPSRPTRIVSLAPSVTEILYYINATDRIVGVTKYTDWPPEIVQEIQNGTIKIVGGYWSPSLEAILSLNPDLVIGVANVPVQAQIKQELAAYGIPMILLPQDSIQAIKDAILMAGQATGNIAEAARAAANYEAHILSIKLAGENVTEKETVALIVWINPIYIAGNGTFQGNGIEWIGAVNAFAGINGWAAISPEQLLEAKPTVIITTGITPSNLTSFLNQTLGENATMQIPAVKNNRIYCVEYPLTNLLDRPSPRFAQGLLLLQYLVYPQLYGVNATSLPHCLGAMPNITWPSP